MASCGVPMVARAPNFIDHSLRNAEHWMMEALQRFGVRCGCANCGAAICYTAGERGFAAALGKLDEGRD